MPSPVAAILWENWRLTRVEAAWRLSLGITAVLFIAMAVADVGPDAGTRGTGAIVLDERARQGGAIMALAIIVLMNFPMWLSIGKLKGGRMLDGYRPGFPLYLLYARPIRTAVLVGVPMAYQAALAAAVYLLSALVLRVTFDYAVPLLPVAASIAAVHLAQAAGDWSTRSKIAQLLGTVGPVLVLGLVAINRREWWPLFMAISLRWRRSSRTSDEHSPC